MSHSVLSTHAPDAATSCYNTMFGEFLDAAANEQYHYMLELESGLFDRLKKRDMFADHPCLSLMDLCCGEGTNAPKVLRAIRDAAGVESIAYTGVDVQPDSIGRMNAMLSRKENQSLVAPGSRAVEADVFGGGLSGLSQQADVVRLSHGLYYMQTDVDGRGTGAGGGEAQTARFLREAMDRVKDEGFALMFHETSASDLFSPAFDYMRSNGTAIAKMTDASERLARAARAGGYHLAEVEFAPKLYFPALNAGELERLEAVRTLGQLEALNPRQKRWVKLLMFAVQPPVDEFESFLSEGKLGEYVRKAAEIMARNPRAEIQGREEPPYFLIRQRMQAICKDAETAETLSRVCGELKAELEAGNFLPVVQSAMHREQAARGR